MGRTRKDCPFPGCKAKSLLRLPNHLNQVHKMNKEERRKTMSTQASRDSNIKRWWETRSVIPFQPCSSITLSGITGSGKTQWVYRFLQHLDGMYTNDPPKKILYCFGVYQPLFDDMERIFKHFTLHAGVPSTATIEEFADGSHHLIVLDDLMHQVLERKDVEVLFTQGCHHRKLSVVFLTQNLFGQGKSARTIALNTWYLVVFKNLRDVSQINTLGRQLFPGKPQILMEAYRDVMKQPYAYLIVDMTPGSEDKYRLRSHVFPGEDPWVYVPKN